MTRETTLTARSSVGDWLKHPVGGPMLRELLQQGGQSEQALAPVRMLSLQRLVGMSGGRLPQAVVDELVTRVNGGSTPTGTPEASSTEPQAVGNAEEWQERIVPGRFTGRTLIVTGAASGIGRATASRIGREGGRVVAVDLADDALKSLSAEAASGEWDLVTVRGDISSADDVQRVVAAAGDRIDGLANVAGIMDDFSPLHDLTDAVWERVMAVNVTGMMMLSRAVLPAMLAAGSGSIVNVASEASLRGSAAGVAYTTSKHAVIGLTRSSAFMYAPNNIRINAVAPGPVATGIQATFGSEFGQERLAPFMATIPPVAIPEQLAASISFLLSEDGANITGAIIPSDGGWSVQ